MLHRYRVRELAEDLGVSERDIIDIAHDAGVTEFEQDGFELDYEDFDRPMPLFSQRGYNERNDFVIDVEDVELIIDGPVVERFQYLTGANL